MMLLGRVSWDNFGMIKKSCVRNTLMLSLLFEQTGFWLVSVTLDQTRTDCSSSEDLRVTFQSRDSGPLLVSMCRWVGLKNRMGYDWNTNAASSGPTSARVWAETTAGGLLGSSACWAQQVFVPGSALFRPCRTKGA